jgi:hypothetical protein
VPARRRPRIGGLRKANLAADQRVVLALAMLE